MRKSFICVHVQQLAYKFSLMCKHLLGSAQESLFDHAQCLIEMFLAQQLNMLNKEMNEEQV